MMAPAAEIESPGDDPVVQWSPQLFDVTHVTDNLEITLP